MPYLPRPQKKNVTNWGNSPVAPFLKLAAWKDCRAFYLMEHPLCEVCLFAGILNDITGKREAHVDHFIARDAGGAKLDFRNLVAMCESCHASKSALERHGLEILSIGPDGEKHPADGEKERVFKKIKQL